MVKICFNGKSREISESMTVVGFLKGYHIDSNIRGVALAVNGTIVPRSDWELLRFQEGDLVEVIQATQGG
jgi:sulfur carrier protein